ncbi:MAG: hypothetical protein IKN39_02100 [Clostridia bacterium]|nr:hypothetical protein [Clostridia bacterium]
MASETAEKNKQRGVKKEVSQKCPKSVPKNKLEGADNKTANTVICVADGVIYNLDTSIILCSSVDMFGTKKTLYYSENKNFFIITENDTTNKSAAYSVEAADRKDAIDLMQSAPQNIVMENYIKVFGTPKQG